MARPAISEVVKIRKQIIQLPEEDFQDLVRDIEIIQEIREEIHLKAVENGEYINGK